APALAASGKQPAPPGSFPGAPPEFTHFTTHELMRGFFALAFGTDLMIGAKPKGVRRFDHPIRVHVLNQGSTDRTAAMEHGLSEYGEKIPKLRLGFTTDAAAADVIVRLIDEKDFGKALTAAFGSAITKRFVAQTDPQCMTSVKSQVDGEIVSAVSFVIVDKGD